MKENTPTLLPYEANSAKAFAFMFNSINWMTNGSFLAED